MIILDMKKPASCETCPLHWNEQGMMCCRVTHDLVRENCPIKAEIPNNVTNGDAVNREAVDTLVDELARAISDERCFISRGRSTGEIMSDILHLPSVTQKSETYVDGIHAIGYREGYKDAQKQKSGKWEDLHRCWVCSECGQQTHIEHNYCPNCGAKMESEG